MTVDFSVIVPTYNRPAPLRDCLSALAIQSFPRERFEVLIADDGGQWSPAALVMEFEPMLSIRLITLTHGGPGPARNRAAEIAQGRWLAFTDDDCRPDTDWLKRLATTFSHSPGAMIGGRVINALDRNPYSRASQLITDLVYAHYNKIPESARFFASNNMAMAAEAFHALGGFDEGFRVVAAEDRELCDRWRMSGLSMVYQEDAVVRHAHNLNLAGFVSQHFNYGRGAAWFHHIRANRGSGRLWNELSFHLDFPNWLSHFDRKRLLAECIQTIVLLAVWQVTNLLGYLYEILVRSGYRPRPIT